MCPAAWRQQLSLAGRSATVNHKAYDREQYKSSEIALRLRRNSVARTRISIDETLEYGLHSYFVSTSQHTKLNLHECDIDRRKYGPSDDG